MPTLFQRDVSFATSVRSAPPQITDECVVLPQVESATFPGVSRRSILHGNVRLHSPQDLEYLPAAPNVRLSGSLV